MCKYLIAVLLLCSYFTQVEGQSLAVNTDGTPANASALLDVKSNNKGVLIPRLTAAEKNAVPLPATGLLVYQSGPDSIGFHYYDGSKWNWMISNFMNDTLAWKTKGNAGTLATTHFLGTTDNVPLLIKTNNQERMRITTNNEVAIGTPTPNSTYGFAKMEIASEGFLAPCDLLIRNAVNDAGYAPAVILQHSRGNLASPVSVNNGDYLGAFGSMNYDGTNYIQSAGIDIFVDGPVSTNKVSSKLLFNTRDTAGSYAGRMVIKSNGKIGIGNLNPLALTQITGGNFLVNGIVGTSSLLEFSGAGTKMFFYPRKSAFRAGTINSTEWDDANIGNYSTGLGVNAQAKSDYSVSIGEGNIAETNPFAFAIGRQNHSSGFAAMAMGHFSEATGDYSTAIGLRDTVSGFGASALGSWNKVTNTYGFAAGYTNTVNGVSASALGNNNFAPSFGETTIGNYASTYTALNAGDVNLADRVFTIGNGTATSNRSNAMVVLKNGNTGLSTSTPSSTLQVAGTIAVDTSMNIVGGLNGSPVILSTQKSYIGLTPVGSNQYFQLPNPGTCPGRIYYLRNNDNLIDAFLGTASAQICPGDGNCIPAGSFIQMAGTGSRKTLVCISDGVNWTVGRFVYN